MITEKTDKITTLQQKSAIIFYRSFLGTGSACACTLNGEVVALACLALYIGGHTRVSATVRKL